MRRTLTASMAAAVLVSVCTASTARAQTVVPPAPPAAPEAPSARYARRSIALLGGFDATHAPFADQTTVDVINVGGSARFVMLHGFVVQPGVSVGYYNVTPGPGAIGAQPAQSATLSTSLRIGYAHALSDRIAITAMGGYGFEARTRPNAFTNGKFTHSFLGQLSAEIFLTPQVFLEPSVVVAVVGSDEGIGLSTGLMNSLGVMF